MVTDELKETKKILDILGYSTIEENNKIIIIDDNKKKIGYIFPQKDSTQGKFHFIIDSDAIQIDYVADEMSKLNFKRGGTLYFDSNCLGFRFVTKENDEYTFKLEDESSQDLEGAISVSRKYQEDEYDVFRSFTFKINEPGNSTLNFLKYDSETKNRKKFWDKGFNHLLAVVDKDSPDDLRVTAHNTLCRKGYHKIKPETTIEEYIFDQDYEINIFNNLRMEIIKLFPCKKDLLFELCKDKIEKYNLSTLFGIDKMKYELRLLDLLGYHYEKSPDEDKLLIIDDHGKEVGYTEWRNLGLKDLGVKICCGSGEGKVHTVIDSDTIKANFTRGKTDSKVYYLDVKGVGTIVFRFGKHTFLLDNSVLNICSDKYGHISINHRKGNEYGIIPGPNTFSLNYYYKYNGYEIREDMRYRNMDYSNRNLFKEYSYLLCYGKENEDILKHKGYEVWGSTDAKSITINPTVRDIRTHEFKDYDTKAQTVEEFAIEHGRGLELFDQIRDLLNVILPFKKELLYEIFKDKIDEFGYNILFYPEERKTKTK